MRDSSSIISSLSNSAWDAWKHVWIENPDGFVAKGVKLGVTQEDAETVQSAMIANDEAQAKVVMGQRPIASLSDDELRAELAARGE